jgi:hypothetical protein
LDTVGTKWCRLFLLYPLWQHVCQDVNETTYQETDEGKKKGYHGVDYTRKCLALLDD